VNAVGSVDHVRDSAEEYAWHGDEYGDNRRALLEEALCMVAEGFSPAARRPDRAAVSGTC
jgi:hypothetical protein